MNSDSEQALSFHKGKIFTQIPVQVSISGRQLFEAGALFSNLFNLFAISPHIYSILTTDLLF